MCCGLGPLPRSLANLHIRVSSSINGDREPPAQALVGLQVSHVTGWALLTHFFFFFFFKILVIYLTASERGNTSRGSGRGRSRLTREEPAWPWGNAPIRALVQRIHQLQAERAQAFRRLEESPYKLNPRLLPCKAPPLETPVVAAFLGASVPPCRVCVGGRGRASASHDMLPVPCPHQVALLQLMGAPELSGQENALEMHPLKMKVIKTMEAISEVLQDLRFDAESAE
uniref:Uncharacterized protein n=1 Tax=Ursus maritimus TaxID=29073 RepID=A0A452TUJ1_URSMA